MIFFLKQTVTKNSYLHTKNMLRVIKEGHTENGMEIMNMWHFGIKVMNFIEMEVLISMLFLRKD